MNDSALNENAVPLTENHLDAGTDLLLLDHFAPHPLDVCWRRVLVVAACAIPPDSPHRIRVICGQDGCKS